MTNIAVRPTINPNDQTPVTIADRQALLQKLAGRGGSEIWINIEKNAFENSQGIKSKYLGIMQHYFAQIKKAQANNVNQTSTATAPTMNNTVHYVNQSMNLPQQSTAPVLNHPQYQLNQSLNQQQQAQPRFSSIQLSATPRVPNPSTTTTMMNNQTTLVNQQVRLPDPQKFAQPTLNPISYSSTPPTIQTIDLSQTYRTQPQQQQQPQPQPMANATLNDYLTQPTTMLNRFPNQLPPVNQRPRPTMNIPDTFAQPSSSTNSNNILQQYVIGDRPMNTNTSPITNQSSTGDRLLQQILLSNNNNNPVTAAAASSNKMPIQNRQASLPINPTPMSQSIRSATTTNNNNLSNNLNSIRPSLPTRQTSPSPPVVIMPTSTQTSNVQFPSSSNVPIQHSPLNNTNPSHLVNAPVNSQSPSMPNNNYSSPPTTNRSVLLSASGSISSPDEETIQLIKYLKENISRLPPYYQKYTNEGNMDKARHIQAIHQQIVQFIQQPTYENLNQAKQIRDMLEKAANRLQAMNNTTAPPNVTITSSSTVPAVNEFQNLEKVFTEFLASDSKKRQRITQFAIEPLSDVINGVPHKKMRLDIDEHSHRIYSRKSHLSLIDKLNAELVLLPKDCFSVQFLPVSHTSTINEYKDEDLNKNGLVLRCKLIESDLPLVPILRLRLFPRYPEEQPEILSLTKTHPPKLEFTNDHPFFEQLSTIFISHLFKLPAQHTVTDVLNLWRQSVRSAL